MREVVCHCRKTDQVKSLEWQVRKAEKKGRVAKTVVEEVVDKIRAILEG